ncbi:MAG: sugar phosphate isomerase/epimerase [Lachnospiraceae bacterium]|nr:sugar phosphate isomerase/epimerase [Lachnospiraceae bacterium]
MFKIAVQTAGPEEYYGVDGAYRLIKEAGFDAVDANIDHLLSYGDIVKKKIPPVYRKGLSEKAMLEYFRPWKDAAKKYGLDNYQAHAPFPSYLYLPDDPEYNEWLIEMLKKTIVGCASIDCHHLIIHPFFPGYDDTLSAEEEHRLNIESYLKLAKTAEKYDVTINLENMFTGHNKKIYAAICNDGEEAARYVDELNDAAGKKVFGFCLDVGHAMLASKDIKRFMCALGPRITAFHVHDNDGVDDQHLAPYMGKVDWDRFIEGLRAIGFNRTLSFETFNVWNVVDKEIAPEMMKVIAKTGRMFAERASVK